jgi:hypothetical protein
MAADAMVDCLAMPDTDSTSLNLLIGANRFRIQFDIILTPDQYQELFRVVTRAAESPELLTLHIKGLCAVWRCNGSATPYE